MCRVLIVVLCGWERMGWVNPALSQNLLEFARDQRVEGEIRHLVNVVPVDYARNKAMMIARDEVKPEWLILIDNDQAFDQSPLDIVVDPLAQGKDVIGYPTLMISSVEDQRKGRIVTLNTGAEVLATDGDGRFGEVTRCGGGAFIINRTIWENIPGPWFKFLRDETTQEIRVSEDFNFCDLVRAKGFSVWVPNKACRHFHTVDLLYVARHLRID